MAVLISQQDQFTSIQEYPDAGFFRKRISLREAHMTLSTTLREATGFLEDEMARVEKSLQRMRAVCHAINQIADMHDVHYKAIVEPAPVLRLVPRGAIYETEPGKPD